MKGPMRRRQDRTLRGHHGRIFEVALESGEPLIVTIGQDNTVIASFPHQRRVYRHAVPAEPASLYSLACQPGFIVAVDRPGVVVLSAPGHARRFVWHLEDARASGWVTR